MKTKPTRTASKLSRPVAPKPSAAGAAPPVLLAHGKIRDGELGRTTLPELLLYGLAFESENDPPADILEGSLTEWGVIVSELYNLGEDKVGDLAERAYRALRRAEVAHELRRRLRDAERAAAARAAVEKGAA